jgi:mannosylglycerate hydrolase MGH1-like protein
MDLTELIMTNVYRYDSDALPKIICPDHPQWVAMVDRAWATAFANLEYPDVAGWKPQMTCMPGSSMIWQWDSCLMTLYARYGNGTIPVMNNFDNLYRLQRDDGYLCMGYTIGSDTEAFPGRINPPLFAWCEWEYYRLSGDDSRFAMALEVLTRLFDWTQANRRRVSGLYWFEDSGSSGMDNAPRGGYHAANLAGSDLCYIDLACQQALTAMTLKKIAAHLGNQATADRFDREYEQIKVLVNAYHWSSRDGFYYDLFSRSRAQDRHNFLNHKTVAAFWSLLSGITDRQQTERLIAVLTDPECFWRPHPVPSLSADDPNYDPAGGYWLGGVWAPTNYMITAGLRKVGYDHLAREIAVKHLDAMIATAADATYDSIWECYAPESFRPATNSHGVLSRRDFVGWSGLGPIAMLIEMIFGFDFDAASNRMDWHIGTDGLHGIENLIFNGRTISAICHPLADDATGRRIELTTTDPLTVSIHRLGKSNRIEQTLAPGHHEFTL